MLDESFHSDLLKIMDDGSDEIKKVYPEGSFARLFLEGASKGSKSQLMASSHYQMVP